MTTEPSPEDWKLIDEALRAGKKIVAIKRFRQATNIGLTESKVAVEARALDRGIALPADGGPIIGCAVFIAAVGAIVTWLILRH